MIATIVKIYVKKDNINDFIIASTLNHRESVKEKGNLRFDLLQSSDNPSHFVLYEAYISEESAAAHKNTEHYKKWRETVANWMAKPREGLKHSIIMPEQENV